MGFYSFLAVGAGAALGAWLRWGLGALLNPMLPSIPMGTLAANLLGGYLVGVAVAVFAQHPGLAPEARLLVITGFLGGLTTFSTFSAEAMHLLTRGEYTLAAVHMVSHLAGSLALTLLGLLTVKVFVKA
ncbi:MAG: fluoride efflux transporter CrcB [Geothrix sp.]|nr:fluoride efflux transporter CrcB [Geothrix sp.]